MHAHHLQRLANTLAQFGCRHLPDLKPERNILRNSHVRPQCITLKHHAAVTLLRRDVGDVAVTKANDSSARLKKAGNHAQDGGLATPGWTQQKRQAALGGFHGHTIDSHGLSIGLAEIFKSYRNHRASTIPTWKHAPTNYDPLPWRSARQIHGV